MLAATPQGTPNRELCFVTWVPGQSAHPLPARAPPGRAVAYQLTGAHITDDAHIHPEAIGEGWLQMDGALPVRLRQLACMSPIQVLDGPQLHLVCALQGPRL